MRFFQGAIEGLIVVMFLGVAIWWSSFCFTKGYSLGKHGTENRLFNWMISTLMDDESKNNLDNEHKKEFDMNPLRWLEEITDSE